MRYRSLIDLLQKAFEVVEPIAPKGGVVIHPVNQGLQPLELGAIIDVPTFRPLDDKSGLLQMLKVLGNGALRNAAAAG